MDDQRHLFEIPEGVAYLNCAYMSPQLKSVSEAGFGALRRKTQPWTVTPADFFTEGEIVRSLFARLVNADAEGVAIVPSVSYGIGIAATNLGITSGDTIVILEEQFPSNVYPWVAAAERTGADVISVKRPGDLDWAAAVIEAIDERTEVVAVPNYHWTDGSRIDVAAVGKAARAAGAALVIDASQSLGAAPLDVAEIQPDFLACVGYKWLLGPYSFGYLWVAEEHRFGQPLEHGWITRAKSEDFSGLVDYVDDYQPGARRYDMGERSNFVLTPMAIAALEQLLAWGIDEVAEYASGLSQRAELAATSLGLEPTPAQSRGPHLTGVRVPGGVPPGLAMDLARGGVYVSVRGDSIRVSAHAFNSTDDIDRLFSSLAEFL
jgi:selenocysteine lyase/cysteine desulfurase